VPTTTNFIATNGLPGKDGKTTKTTAAEAACIDDSTSIRNHADTKRKQSSAMFNTLDSRHDGWLVPQVRFRSTTMKECSKQSFF